MIRSALYLGLAGIVLALVLLASHPVMQTVEGARATATSTLTATPTIAALAAPSGVHVVDSVLYWNDNSNDEEGFRLEFELCGHSFHYQVPANTTSFSIPPEAQPHVDCPCGCRSFDVTAFNSEGGQTGYAVFPCTDCAPAITPTLIATIAMPRTGAGRDRGPGNWGQAALLASGALTLTGGIALFTRTKMQDRRRDS